MPTIWHEQGFAFGFFSADRNEPPYIHVFKEDKQAKWWLDPIAEARRGGFNESDRSKVRRIIVAQREFFISRWRQHFH
jgi:hypothetical protein